MRRYGSASPGRGNERAAAFNASKDLPPFPKQQMLILALCRICEPIAFMSIFPYIYYMIEDFHITDDTNKISFYAGMVTSAFTFAEFSTGVLWGRLSDKIGRKPVLLTGLAGTALSVLVFGFAPNLTVAIIARALGGLLNGNIGVLQTTVAELITVKEHQPRAYTIMPMVWSLGSIIGPVIGGALARPCIVYPSIFSQESIWGRYPYLLPNLFSAVCVCLGVIIGILFLEETHAEKKKQRDRGLECGRSILSLVARTRARFTPARALKAEEEPLLAESDEQLPGYQSRDTSPQRISASNSDSNEPLTLDSDQSVDAKSRTFTKPVLCNIISYGILAFHTMTFDQLFPVFLSTQPPNNANDVSLPFKFTGGFGLGPDAIGIILSVQGVYSMVSTLVFFPFFAKRLGTLHLFRLLAVSYFLLYLLTPYLVLLPKNLQMPGIYIMMVWKVTFSTMAYPSNAILLTNSAPSLLSLGTINGVAASTASLCRAFGPTISGLLYALGLQTGVSGLAWWFSGAVTISGALVSFLLTEPRGRLDEKTDDVENSLGSRRASQVAEDI